MSFVQNMIQRRVPHYLSAYCVGGFGLVQFVEFLEGRLQFSPNWVNLAALGLLFLLPMVTILAWSQGRPGKDRWGRLEKIAIPVNFVLAAALLFFVFQGKDLGSITTTVAVEDEHGKISERVVPRNIYLKRVVLYAFENDDSADLEWLRHGAPMMLNLDLSQDPFVDSRTTIESIVALRESGYPSGLDVPRSLQRKIARDAHFPFFLTGTVRLEGNINIIETELHDSESGKVLAQHEYRGPDIFVLIDDLSLQLRKDLDIPAGYIEQHVDVAISEILSEDLEAVSLFCQASSMAGIHNEWEETADLLLGAVQRDPTFALAQNLLSLSCTMIGRAAESTTAINAAMEHLYRLPERVQLQIKVMYYFNVKQDADKAMAVVEMWTQLYPQDSSAFVQKAYLHLLRNERETSIAAYEEVLRIDPHQYEVLMEIGDLYKALGDFTQAEKNLRQYAERFPSNIQAWSVLANLYLDFGELKRAAQTLERALLIEPGHIATRLLLADIAAKEGHFKEADKLLVQLTTEADTAQEQVDVLTRQMTLCRYRGQINKVFIHLEDYLAILQTLNTPPQVNMLHAIYLQFLMEAGKAEEALSAIQELAKTTTPPVDQLIDYFRFNPLIELGRLDEAEALINDTGDLVQQLKVGVWDSRISDARSQLAIARNDFTSAEKYSRQAVETNPTSPRLQRQLGHTLRLQDKFDEAEQVFSKMLKINPGNGKTNFELALLFFDTNDLDLARHHLGVTMLAWQDADSTFVPAIAARKLQETLTTKGNKE